MRLSDPRLLVMLWIGGFAGSLVIQSCLQPWFAAGSAWGANRGWQNEIAIWNLGVIVMLAGLLRARAGVERHVLPGLAVLSACFAVNHIVGLVEGGGGPSNWAGATANLAAVALYAAHRVALRRGRTAERG